MTSGKGGVWQCPIFISTMLAAIASPKLLSCACFHGGVVHVSRSMFLSMEYGTDVCVWIKVPKGVGTLRHGMLTSLRRYHTIRSIAATISQTLSLRCHLSPSALLRDACTLWESSDTQTLSSHGLQLRWLAEWPLCIATLFALVTWRNRLGPWEGIISLHVNSLSSCPRHVAHKWMSSLPRWGLLGPCRTSSVNPSFLASLGTPEKLAPTRRCRPDAGPPRNSGWPIQSPRWGLGWPIQNRDTHTHTDTQQIKAFGTHPRGWREWKLDLDPLRWEYAHSGWLGARWKGQKMLRELQRGALYELMPA